MSLVLGQGIASADLNALTETARAAMQEDNAQLPLGLQHKAHFHGIVTGSAPRVCRSVFTVPWDCYVETLSVSAAGFTAASVLSLEVAAPGVLTSFPIALSGTVGVAPVKLTRILYDGTAGRVGAAHMASNRAFRVLLAGTRVTVRASTTVNVAAAAFCEATLCLRQFFGRRT